MVKAGGISPIQTVAEACPIFPDEVISFKNISNVSVVVHPAAVSTITDTDVVEESTGAGVKVLVVVTNCGVPPTEKVYVDIAEVEVTVKVIESFSQNVDEDADEAKAVEVKLITGLSTIWTSISGEKEEQP